MNLTLTAQKRSNRDTRTARIAARMPFAAVILGIIFLLSATAAIAGPIPRGEVMIKGEQIRLGDVFDGLRAHADFVLAPAPKPGQDLVWNAPTLTRIATAFDLPWRPKSGEAVHIRRAAVLVDADTLRAFIRDHLASAESDNTYNITITSDVPEIVVPTTGTPQLQLADFRMQPSGGGYSAIIRVSNDEGKSQDIALRGLAEKIVRIPVLKNTRRAGDVIEADDIEWITQPALGLRKDIATDARSVIGATPRKIVAAGNYIRLDDLTQPKMIARGDIVTMVYTHGGMYLTAKGKALEDGAMGQTIKVSNVGSNRQLDAEVTAKKEVTIQ